MTPPVRRAAVLAAVLTVLAVGCPVRGARPAYAAAAAPESTRTSWVGPVATAVLPARAATTAPPAAAARTAAPASSPPLGLISKSSVATGGRASSSPNPSVAQSGSVVFYTADWFAAFSSDGGAGWTSIDPTTALPVPYGMTFSGRQRAIYDPGQDIFVWTLQYGSNVSATAPNLERVAVAHGGIGVLHRAWSYFDIHPSDIGPWNDTIDSPYLALSQGHLFLSADLVGASGAWDRSVMLRFALPSLASAVTGSSLQMESFATSIAFHLAATQGATATMYFASDRFCDAGGGAGPQPSACSSGGGVQYVNTLRVYSWPDSAGAAAIGAQYVPTSSVPYGTSACNPGGPELCAADDHRILDGFGSGSTIGFLYDAAQDPTGAVAVGPRPFPYLQLTRVDVSGTSWTVIDEPSIYSASTSWWAGGAAANSRGDIAVAAYQGSVGPAPATGAYLLGRAAGDTSWAAPVAIAGSSATPPSYPAGSFLTVRPAFPWPDTFAATGAAVTSACASAANPCPGTDTVFARFGRAADLAGAQVIPVRPARIMDTRHDSQVGPFSTPIGTGETRTLTVVGVSSIPSSATGVVLDVGVANASTYSYLTVFPGGSKPPLASNLNWSPGQTLANLVEVNLGGAGDVSYYNANGTVDVFFDVVGFVTRDTSTYGTAGLLNPIQPVRYLDTRTDVGGHRGQLAPGETLRLQVAGVVPAGSGAASAPVPGPGNSTAGSVVLNLTAVGLNRSLVGASYLSVFPSDAAAATAQQTSDLNFTNGDIRPNRVLVKLGPDGVIDIYNSQGYVDVVVDVGGWFSSSTTAQGAYFHAQPPRRLLDTRPASRVGELGPFGPRQTQALQVAYRASIPATATAVALNVTATDASAGSFLTVAPDLPSLPPPSSDLNWPPGDTRPNNDLVAVNQASMPGMVAIYNDQGSVDVVVDVVGWFGNP